jgi:hypothetical protein
MSQMEEETVDTAFISRNCKFIIFGHMLGQNRNESITAAMLFAISNSHVRVHK